MELYAEAYQQLASISGPDSVRAADYKGDVVLMNFWGIWCPPCISELPHLKKVHDHYSDRKNAHIITVYLPNEMGKARNLEEVKRWVGGKGFEFTVIYDGDRSIKDSLGFSGVPLNLIFDQRGYIVKDMDGTPLKTFERRAIRQIDKILDAEHRFEGGK